MKECTLPRECFVTTLCAVPPRVVREGQYPFAYSFLASFPFEYPTNQTTFRRFFF